MMSKEWAATIITLDGSTPNRRAAIRYTERNFIP